MSSTSGAFNGNTSENEGYRFEWWLISQSISNNRSRIGWRCGWRFDTYGCRGLRNGKAVVNGSTRYSNTTSGDGVHGWVSGHNHRPRLWVASGEMNISHNSNGNKSFSASGELEGWQGFRSSGSGSWTLPSIPQKSDPPSTPSLSDITSSSIRAQFTDGGGGAPIDSRQLAYSTTTSRSDGTIISSSGNTNVTGLNKGTRYYFWARTHNAAGWSDWSGRSSAVTHREPSRPSAPSISNVGQVSAYISWSAPNNGGTSIIEYQLAYNTTNSTSGASTINTTNRNRTVTSLDPGRRYWFFVRARNSVGWSSWSPSSNATLIAGAKVRVSGTWRRAVPYVRVSGVWRVARPWVRASGTWRQTGD